MSSSNANRDGRITLEFLGSIDTSFKAVADLSGGNSAKLVIEVSGNQHGSTMFKSTDDGFVLTMYGEWEHSEFFEAMDKIRSALYRSEQKDVIQKVEMVGRNPTTLFEEFMPERAGRV